MDTKEMIIKLLMERLEMISKTLKYDLKADEKAVYQRDLKMILDILDDEKDLREQWLNMK